MISLQALHDLPLREKLFVMEALWDDLSATASDLEVPAWQKEVLDEREEALAGGPAAEQGDRVMSVSIRAQLSRPQ